MGQELRRDWARWYASNALTDNLSALPAHSIGSFKFSFRKVGDNRIGLIHRNHTAQWNRVDGWSDSDCSAKSGD